MARRKGPTLTQRVGVLEYAVRVLQEQQARHTLKLAELDRRLTAAENVIERHRWNESSSALSVSTTAELRDLSRELELYKRLTG